MERKYYDLTFSQMLMYYNLSFSRKKFKSIVNICTMMHFDGDIDVDRLLQAVGLAEIRNISSRIRIHKFSRKEIKQYFSEQPPEAIEVLDYSDKSQEEFDKCIDTLSKTPIPNDYCDTQLYKVKLFLKPDKHYGLYFCVSHLAFDAFSLMQMASDILAIYSALRDGKPIPANKNNPLPSFQEDWDYLTSKKRDADRKFWADYFEDESLYNSINGPDCKEYNKGKRYGNHLNIFNSAAKHVNLTLDKSIVKQVQDCASSLKVSAQCIYLLALRSYLCKCGVYTDDFTTMNTVARRATKVQKNGGGTRVQGIFLRLKFPNTTTFADACRLTQQEQFKVYAHSDLSMMEVSPLYKKKFKCPAIKGYNFTNITFQPYMVALDESVPVHFTLHSNGANNVPIYLTIMALDNSGDLNFNYDYNVTFADDERIRKMHDHMVKFLSTASASPDMTLEQLMKL